MKYIICKSLDEFNALDKFVVTTLKNEYPSYHCERWAEPNIVNIKTGEILFPIDDGHPSNYLIMNSLLEKANQSIIDVEITDEWIPYVEYKSINNQ